MRLAACSFDATVSVWEKSRDGDFECVAHLEGPENEIKVLLTDDRVSPSIPQELY